MTAPIDAAAITPSPIYIPLPPLTHLSRHTLGALAQTVFRTHDSGNRGISPIHLTYSGLQHRSTLSVAMLICHAHCIPDSNPRILQGSIPVIDSQSLLDACIVLQAMSRNNSQSYSPRIGFVPPIVLGLAAPDLELPPSRRNRRQHPRHIHWSGYGAMPAVPAIPPFVFLAAGTKSLCQTDSHPQLTAIAHLIKRFPPFSSSTYVPARSQAKLVECSRRLSTR
ncbi:hypothetical protein C8Q73DRAFT_353805 [Cubamyces lactineus]|nr:hypothetical protein C8Q73DRAFT_353805 [Cubamyces lactineus]